MALLREIDGEEDAREGNHGELLIFRSSSVHAEYQENRGANAPPLMSKPPTCSTTQATYLVLLHRLDRNITQSRFHLWHRDHHFEHSVVQLGLDQVRFRALGSGMER